MTNYLSLASRELERCNKCGMCTSACPTFQVTGMETQVTRGRVSLAQDVLAGTLTLQQAADSLNSCLLCQACVSVCPPKVDIVKIITSARAQMLAEQPPSAVQRFVLGAVLRHPRLLRIAAQAGALVELVGLRDAAVRLGLLKGTLGRAAKVGPRLSLIGARRAIGRLAPLAKAPRTRVAYYVTCVKDAVFPQAARATVAVLKANDVDVVLPQVPCCGLPHRSAGDLAGMKEQARRAVGILGALDVDAIIVDDGSCTAHLLHLPEILAGEPEEQAASRVAAKIRDLAVFLEELGPAPMGEIKARVTWHAPCSCRHGMRAGPGGQHPVEATRRLLRRIPGITLIETPLAVECCGGAGSIMITQPEKSDLLLERTWGALSASAPEYVLASSPSCVMQLQRGARERSSPTRVIYLSEFLAMAYRGAAAK